MGRSKKTSAFKIISGLPLLYANSSCHLKKNLFCILLCKHIMLKKANYKMLKTLQGIKNTSLNACVHSFHFLFRSLVLVQNELREERILIRFKKEKIWQFILSACLLCKGISHFRCRQNESLLHIYHHKNAYLDFFFLKKRKKL